MLILAGVTIIILTGENGIINRATDAKIQTEIANIKEQIQIEILSEQADNQGNISDESLKQILEKYGTLSEEEKLTDKTLTTDEGNYKIKVSDIFNGTTIKDEQKGPAFTTVANAPDITGFNKSNTYYVAWDLTTSPYNIDEETTINGVAPNNWYDYTAGINKWANIKTTGGGNDCYWVWIPRYAYKVPTKSSTGETIEIKFLEKSTNIPIGETEEITNTTPTPGNWVVHPAFTNSGNGGFGELTGIWVAKFEASSSGVSVDTVSTDLSTTGGGDNNSLKVRSIPNVTSWRGISISNIFTVCKNLTIDGNSVEKVTGIDSHMIKNTEWGACAYLSRSIYGKNSAVWNNPYYTNTITYLTITGICGLSQDMSQTNLNNTFNYNTIGGENASVTGNVYGVYDMAGGAWEYVAGYLNEVLQTNNTLQTYSKNLYDAGSKYKDIYLGSSSSDVSNYANNTNIYGDALYETSINGTGFTSWDSDFSYFMHASYPVLVRGGHASNSNATGVFAFVVYPGDPEPCNGFRPCLVMRQS